MADYRKLEESSSPQLNMLPMERSAYNRRSWMRKAAMLNITFLVVVFIALLWFGTAAQSPAISSTIADTQKVLEYDLPHEFSHETGSVNLNTTLGFEKIYVINLAHRQDKRDELGVMGYVTDIEMEFIDAVKTTDLDKLKIADHPADMHPGMLGCYRSHVNALRKMVEDRVESAIIVEDDVDYDVDFRKALQSLQVPFASLVGSMKQDGRKRGPTEQYPFGHTQDWDLLYLGACLEDVWSTDNNVAEENRNLVGGKRLDWDHPPFVLYRDASTPQQGQMSDNVRQMYKNYAIELDPADAIRRRIVQRAHSPICTTGYAVTRRGAARLLYMLTRYFNSPVDLLMGWAAGDGHVEGYTVFPPLISQWRRAGANAMNSDIHDKFESTATPDKRSQPDEGRADNLRTSMRSNMRSLLIPKRNI